MRISDWSSDVCSSDLVGWSLRQYGEIGHFVEFEVAHVLVEIRAGGGLNAISVAAQKNLVEIQLQYLLLAHHRFDAIGQERFLGLTYIADFVGEEQILRSEEHTSELQSIMRISYAVFSLKKTTDASKTRTNRNSNIHNQQH